MSLKLNPKIEVKESAIEGKGLFAKEPFAKGERFRIVEGKQPSVIMTKKEFEAYTKTVDSYDAVALKDGTYKVGTLSREDDPSNYGNHSCDPNIKQDEDGVIALQYIKVGEEITIDYSQFSPKDWEMECNCGATNCRHKVRGIL